LFPPPSWEQERSRRRRKWRAERRKESVKKDESEKDSDSRESPPDGTETQQVALARENLVTLVAEQKKIHKQKVGLLISCPSSNSGETLQVPPPKELNEPIAR